MEAFHSIRSRLKDDRSRREFDRFIRLVRSGKLDHLDRATQRVWLESRLGLSVSERHFRRVVNRTPN